MIATSKSGKDDDGDEMMTSEKKDASEKKESRERSVGKDNDDEGNKLNCLLKSNLQFGKKMMTTFDGDVNNDDVNDDDDDLDAASIIQDNNTLRYK